MSSLGCLPDPVPDVTPSSSNSPLQPAPPASPTLALTTCISPACVHPPRCAHTLIHTHKSQEQTVPESSGTPAQGLCRALPHAFPSLTKPPAASFKLGAPALGLYRAFFSLVSSLSLFSLSLSFLRKNNHHKKKKKKTMKKKKQKMSCE